MEKIISIDGKEVGFKATGSTISRYRQKFNSDLLVEITDLQAKVNDKGEMTNLSSSELNVFEKLAYIMAWQYDRTIPENPDDWLDEFEIFSLYQALPSIIELWTLNAKGLEKPKKKEEGQSGR